MYNTIHVVDSKNEAVNSCVIPSFDFPENQVNEFTCLYIIFNVNLLMTQLLLSNCFAEVNTCECFTFHRRRL